MSLHCGISYIQETTLDFSEDFLDHPGWESNPRPWDYEPNAVDHSATPSPKVPFFLEHGRRQHQSSMNVH